MSGLSPEMLQRLAELKRRSAERQEQRQKIVRYDDQGREVHDPDALFAAIVWIFAQAHRDGATGDGAPWFICQGIARRLRCSHSLPAAGGSPVAGRT